MPTGASSTPPVGPSGPAGPSQSPPPPEEWHGIAETIRGIANKIFSTPQWVKNLGSAMSSFFSKLGSLFTFTKITPGPEEQKRKEPEAPLQSGPSDSSPRLDLTQDTPISIEDEDEDDVSFYDEGDIPAGYFDADDEKPSAASASPSSAAVPPSQPAALAESAATGSAAPTTDKTEATAAPAPATDQSATFVGGKLIVFNIAFDILNVTKQGIIPLKSLADVFLTDEAIAGYLKAADTYVHEQISSFLKQYKETIEYAIQKTITVCFNILTGLASANVDQKDTKYTEEYGRLDAVAKKLAQAKIEAIGKGLNFQASFNIMLRALYHGIERLYNRQKKPDRKPIDAGKLQAKRDEVYSKILQVVTSKQEGNRDPSILHFALSLLPPLSTELPAYHAVISDEIKRHGSLIEEFGAPLQTATRRLLTEQVGPHLPKCRLSREDRTAAINGLAAKLETWIKPTPVTPATPTAPAAPATKAAPPPSSIESDDVFYDAGDEDKLAQQAIRRLAKAGSAYLDQYLTDWEIAERAKILGSRYTITAAPLLLANASKWATVIRPAKSLYLSEDRIYEMVTKLDSLFTNEDENEWFVLDLIHKLLDTLIDPKAAAQEDKKDQVEEKVALLERAQTAPYFATQAAAEVWTGVATLATNTFGYVAEVTRASKKWTPWTWR